MQKKPKTKKLSGRWINFFAPTSTHKGLQKMAANEDLSMSAFMRKLIRDKIKAS